MKETFYELGYLLVPTLSETEVTETKDAIKASITSVGAEMKSEGDVHFIDLAYEMVKKVKSKNIKFDQAHFGWIKFTASAEEPNVLEKELKKHANILRTLIVKTVEDDAVTDMFVSEEITEDESVVDDGVDLGEDKKEEVEEKTEEAPVEKAEDAEPATEEATEEAEESEKK